MIAHRAVHPDAEKKLIKHNKLANLVTVSFLSSLSRAPQCLTTAYNNSKILLFVIVSEIAINRQRFLNIYHANS